jgi:hypothetical protein
VRLGGCGKAQHAADADRERPGRRVRVDPVRGAGELSLWGKNRKLIHRFWRQAADAATPDRRSVIPAGVAIVEGDAPAG